ncbi:spore coat protein GerQ [Paenibacillus senegalensis]|uniref:spore coat protein GerQ n=1 Tax=Paenibacillus senegalensis TaxID=1465766 RepID=UPI00028889A5|nr:spore coat protein GerQ [Paenibacillus senegalensis]
MFNLFRNVPPQNMQPQNVQPSFIPQNVNTFPMAQNVNPMAQSNQQAAPFFNGYPMPQPAPPTLSGQGISPTGVAVPPRQESYIENILRLNLGKIATVYMTFEGNREWNAKIFRGRVEAAGRDHIILSDPQTGKRYILLSIFLNYITFDEPINYEYPYREFEQEFLEG